jgi:secondary thiamine-phosphate synthase enzyme
MSRLATLIVSTIARNDFQDITGKIQLAVDEMGIDNGFIVVFVPHTTAGITINENADVDVRTDMMHKLDEMVPWTNGYRHFEGNSAAHIKASMMGFSETIIVEEGKLLLGTWQGIYFTEFDGPRKRKVHIKGIS